MAVARMQRVELIALLNDRAAWLQELQSADVLEIESIQSDEDLLGNESAVQKDIEAEIGRLDREMGEIDRVLAFLDRFHRIKPTIVQQFAGIRTYLTTDEFRSMVESKQDVVHWVEQADRLNDSLNNISQERASLIAETELLNPWTNLDLRWNDLSGTRKTSVLLGTIEPRRLPELEAAVRSAPFGAELCVVSSNERETALVLFVSHERLQELSQVMAPMNFRSVVLPTFAGTVSDRLSAIRDRLDVLSQEESRIMSEIASLAEKRNHLQSVSDHLRTERAKLSAAEGFAAGQYTFYLKGWVPARDLGRLEQVISHIDRPHHLLVRDPLKDEDPPTALINRPAVSPFEALLQMFSYPKYGETDPTLFMAPFFFIAFGFALGDAGYGLLLALFNLALLKFLPMTRTGRKLAVLFVLGSISTVVIGFGTGGFFGDILRLPPLFGLDPLGNPQMLLVVALAFGVLQMFYGLFLSARNNAEQNGVLSAIAGEGVYMLFLASGLLVLIAFMGGAGSPLARYNQLFLKVLGISAILVIVGSAYGRKGFAILAAIPSGLFKMYNSIGFASDVLSFARLMALALSGAVVGNIINVFARQAFASPMFGLGYVMAAAIFVFGHALNLSLSVLGAFVHASRLQYLEFFGKFYEGGGRPFRPFGPDFKYTRIVQKREA